MTRKGDLKYQDAWSEAEYAIVLELYYNTQPHERDKNNKKVRDVARIIGRTTGAVVYRLGNYSAIDPSSGAKGFDHGGPKAKKMFDKYSGIGKPLEALQKIIRD